MNPTIAHDLMRARIADLHRPSSLRLVSKARAIAPRQTREAA